MLLNLIRLIITIIARCAVVLTTLGLIGELWDKLKNLIVDIKKTRELSEDEIKELRELKELLLKYNMLDKVRELEEVE